MANKKLTAYFVVFINFQLIFFIVIYSRQAWKATRRHGVTRKRTQQRWKVCRKADKKEPKDINSGYQLTLA